MTINQKKQQSGLIKILKKNTINYGEKIVLLRENEKRLENKRKKMFSLILNVDQQRKRK
ncbi:hypothetical protein [Campylobacter coli]|uniref:hypothetical protein n=1 Tax=Campylobacter coli TaxID=195 RepID=UPI0024BE48EA|nr:hypothetical protein [Campylobacter coli]HED8418282.1 hypothetical protein [Campylobacter coli]